MPQPEHLDPSPFSANGGPIGVLLIHGLTGSTVELRPMGEYLSARGFTVRCPLLSGHGTTWKDLIGVRWRDWTSDAESAFGELRSSCDQVLVAGLSLGSLLTLWLGAKYPEITGLIAMAPAVKLRSRLAPLSLGLRHVVAHTPQGMAGDRDLADPKGHERSWSYDVTPMWSVGEAYLLQRRVRQMLPAIAQPLLVFLGKHDAKVPPEAAVALMENVHSSDKTFIRLENSGHNILIDGERESVWEQSYAWMMDVVRSPAMRR